MDKSLISLQSVSCVYGPPGSRARALAMLDEGRSADEVEAGTGCIAGLRDVSLQIPAGEIFVVMGLSGSGKSTLIRTINRLVEPTRGKIMLGDTDVTAEMMPDFSRFRGGRGELCRSPSRLAARPRRGVGADPGARRALGGGARGPRGVGRSPAGV